MLWTLLILIGLGGAYCYFARPRGTNSTSSTSKATSNYNATGTGALKSNVTYKDEGDTVRSRKKKRKKQGKTRGKLSTTTKQSNETTLLSAPARETIGIFTPESQSNSNSTSLLRAKHAVDSSDSSDSDMDEAPKHRVIRITPASSTDTSSSSLNHGNTHRNESAEQLTKTQRNNQRKAQLRKEIKAQEQAIQEQRLMKHRRERERAVLEQIRKKEVQAERERQLARGNGGWTQCGRSSSHTVKSNNAADTQGKTVNFWGS